MRTGQAFLAGDVKSLPGSDIRILSRPCNVEAADAEIGVLRIEVVCETYRAVLEDGDRHVGYFDL